MERSLIKEFVAQWRKMKDALERQQERLKERPFEDGRLKPEEYQTRIAHMIEQLDQLIKAHDDTET